MVLWKELRSEFPVRKVLVGVVSKDERRGQSHERMFKLFHQISINCLYSTLSLPLIVSVETSLPIL